MTKMKSFQNEVDPPIKDIRTTFIHLIKTEIGSLDNLHMSL